VLVYAKSGVGKTSLVKAGVMWRLRREGYLPFVVRFNTSKDEPLDIIKNAMANEANERKIEIKTEEVTSLWGFFKTVELWENDNLLTPIIIFDQFEELFTIQNNTFRNMFLKELSAVTSRFPPNDKSIIEEVIGKINIVASPAPLRIVLSIREDYLGVMEDAAESIPQIFTQRFRLTHLSTESAKIALKEPAQIEDKRFFTRPFEIESDTVKEVINFLKQQIRYVEYYKKTLVEPFQLQLIC